MTDALDTLRPEVREAVQELDGKTYSGSRTHLLWQIIRAELLRLAMIETDALIALDCEHDWQVMRERAEKAEAELAALKARIEGRRQWLFAMPAGIGMTRRMRSWRRRECRTTVGATSACAWSWRNNLMTVFCYLSAVICGGVAASVLCAILEAVVGHLRKDQ